MLPGPRPSAWLSLVALLSLALCPQASAQMVWQRNPANPLLAFGLGGGYTLAPTVLIDHGTGGYHMWFTTRPYGGSWSISDALSPDGTAWFAYVDNPVVQGDAAPFERDGVVYAGVVDDGSRYTMFYTGVSACCGSGVGLATSSDGIHWAKEETNPVLTPSPAGWDSALIGASQAVYHDARGYFLYYEGRDQTHTQGGLATSADGVHWIKHAANPVLAVGDSGAWDDAAASPGGLFEHDGVFYLFYTGASFAQPAMAAVGLATSRDGVHWTRYGGNPVFSGGGPGRWDARIGRVYPLLRDGVLQLWYSGNVEDGAEWSIGVATSPFTPGGSGLPQPDAFALRSALPNPFSGSTALDFELPQSCRVSLRVYDLAGREVATLVNEQRGAGRYRAVWNASGRGSGVYVSRLEAGPWSASRRLILLR
jgi:beta-1,2-mannobiose phosphorylase / 1,2-beta-oligomannan phosphorylase